MGILFMNLVYDSSKPKTLLNLIWESLTSRNLLRVLVKREVSARYKNSYLGIFWAFLTPLITAGIYFIVFSQVFKVFTQKDIPYLSYLVTGMIVINTFSIGVLNGSMIFTQNYVIFSKVKVNLFVFVVSNVISTWVHFLISLIPLLIIADFNNIMPSPFWFAIPIVGFFLSLFSCGIGIFFTYFVYLVEDFYQLIFTATTLLGYLTPILYSIDMVPQKFQKWIEINPLYHFAETLRFCYFGASSYFNFNPAICLLSISVFSLSMVSFYFVQRYLKVI